MSAACLKCGLPGARDFTHACITAGGYGPSPARAAVIYPSDWTIVRQLFQTGYDRGVADAVRLRDLSPLGGGSHL